MTMPTFVRALACWILLAVVLPAAVQGQQIDDTGDETILTVDTTFAVEPGGTFDLSATNGPITVRSEDRASVAVVETIRFDDQSRSEARTFWAENPTRYEASGNTVTVRGPELDNGGWWGGGADVEYAYEVTLPRRFNATLRTAGGAVEVSGLAGTVDGRTAGGAISASDVTGNVTLRTAGGAVTLRSIDGNAVGRTSGGAVQASAVSGGLDVKTAGGGIRVDSVGGRVEARTAGGSIRVAAVQGAVMAKTSGGDVTVRGAAQGVEAKTSGGDIRLEEIEGAVEAKTSGGDIDGRGLRGAVEATTSAGDVGLQDVSGPLTASTSVGDIEVDATASSYAVDPGVELKTSHGDIELTVPAALSASIRAEVRGYGGGIGRDEIRSDVPLTREGGDGSPLRARGDLNGGGPALELKTTGGSIRIRTAD